MAREFISTYKNYRVGSKNCLVTTDKNGKVSIEDSCEDKDKSLDFLVELGIIEEVNPKDTEKKEDEKVDTSKDEDTDEIKKVEPVKYTKSAISIMNKDKLHNLCKELKLEFDENDANGILKNMIYEKLEL